jgi:hypothetical protein
MKMRSTVCDVCYYQDEKLTEAKFNLSRTNGMEKIRVQACDEHHHWMKQFKTFVEMRTGVNNLMYGLKKIERVIA